MSSKSILIGCLVGVVSLATQSVGLTLQRKSHLLEDRKPPGQVHRPPYRRPMWRVGCSLFILSNVFGSSIQISTLPLIVLSPLQAVGLVFNSICGYFILNEMFTTYTLYGTIFVSLGAFLIAYFGSIPEPNHNLESLLRLLHRTPFLIWFYFSVCVLVFVLGYISLLGYYSSASQYWTETEDDGTSASTTGSAESGFSKKVPHLHKAVHFVSVSRKNVPFVQGTLYGVVCGILSAHALLLAKSAVELVIDAFLNKSLQDVKGYQSILIISGWVFCAIMQVYYLNLGLKIISSSIIFPLIFCVYNIVNIFNGLIYFDQFNKLNISEILMIFIGVCLILSGVVYLSMNDVTNANLGAADMCVERQPLLAPESVVAAEVAYYAETPSNVKNLSVDTRNHANLSSLKSLSNTPSSTVSKTHSLTTNASLQPILSESFTENRL